MGASQVTWPIWRFLQAHHIPFLTHSHSKQLIQVEDPSEASIQLQITKAFVKVASNFRERSYFLSIPNHPHTRPQSWWRFQKCRYTLEIHHLTFWSPCSLPTAQITLRSAYSLPKAQFYPPEVHFTSKSASQPWKMPFQFGTRQVRSGSLKSLLKGLYLFWG